MGSTSCIRAGIGEALLYPLSLLEILITIGASVGQAFQHDLARLQGNRGSSQGVTKSLPALLLQSRKLLGSLPGTGRRCQ
jgi:hypothetical protein